MCIYTNLVIPILDEIKIYVFNNILNSRIFINMNLDVFKPYLAMKISKRFVSFAILFYSTFKQANKKSKQLQEQFLQG